MTTKAEAMTKLLKKIARGEDQKFNWVLDQMRDRARDPEWDKAPQSRREYLACGYITHALQDRPPSTGEVAAALNDPLRRTLAQLMVGLIQQEKERGEL